MNYKQLTCPDTLSATLYRKVGPSRVSAGSSAYQVNKLSFKGLHGRTQCPKIPDKLSVGSTADTLSLFRECPVRLSAESKKENPIKARGVAAKFDVQNLEAAKIILGGPASNGDDEALAVQWARLVLMKIAAREEAQARRAA